MKLGNLLLSSLMAFLFTSCWIGDQDDPEILYDTTLIEQICQTPEISLFCEMIYLTSPVLTGNSAGLVPEVAWHLQFASRGIVNGQACSGNVETVFAPNNDAVIDFLEDFPHWNTIYDIPQDTMNLLMKHLVYTRGKLMIPNGSPECTQVTLVGGIEYQMWYKKIIFLTNDEGQFIATSLASGDFASTPIVSPDLSSTDGACYITAQFMAAFPH